VKPLLELTNTALVGAVFVVALNFLLSEIASSTEDKCTEQYLRAQMHPRECPFLLRSHEHGAVMIASSTVPVRAQSLLNTRLLAVSAHSSTWLWRLWRRRWNKHWLWSPLPLIGHFEYSIPSPASKVSKVNVMSEQRLCKQASVERLRREGRACGCHSPVLAQLHLCAGSRNARSRGHCCAREYCCVCARITCPVFMCASVDIDLTPYSMRGL